MGALPGRSLVERPSLATTRPETATSVAGSDGVRSGPPVPPAVVPVVAIVGCAVIVVAVLNGSPATPALTGVGAIAVAAAISDQRTRRIPNRLIVAGLALVVIGAVIVVDIGDAGATDVVGAVLAGAALSGVPLVFALWVVAPGAIGGGDWKLLLVLGAAVGLVAPRAATLVAVVGFGTGALVAVATRSRTVALAGPLALGYGAALAVVVVAPDLVLAR